MTPACGTPRSQAAAADLDLHGPVELAVLAVKRSAARCRLLASDRSVTLRATRLWDVVPGEIVVVKPRKQWVCSGHLYLSGVIESTRLEVAALGLAPLRLEDSGPWDPSEHYWGEEGEPIEEWAKPIIARGRSSRWSRCRLGRTPKIRSPIPSSSPTTARTPVTGRARTRS